MSGYSPRMWWGVRVQSLLRQSLPRARCSRFVQLVPSTSSDGGTTVSGISWWTFPALLECSCSYPYLFNLHFHYTTQCSQKFVLFKERNLCTEIHLLIKDVSLHLTEFCLHPSWDTTFSAHTLQWHCNDSNSLQEQAGPHNTHIIYKKVGKELQTFLFWHQ